MSSTFKTFLTMESYAEDVIKRLPDFPQEFKDIAWKETIIRNARLSHEIDRYTDYVFPNSTVRSYYLTKKRTRIQC